ncbi:hypothetical protein KM043_008755 [Ampulex compressa]|nr:hypothetical protein KM043_008755 [Ampulex compressa]
MADGAEAPELYLGSQGIHHPPSPPNPPSRPPRRFTRARVALVHRLSRIGPECRRAPPSDYVLSWRAISSPRIGGAPASPIARTDELAATRSSSPRPAFIPAAPAATRFSPSPADRHSAGYTGISANGAFQLPDTLEKPGAAGIIYLRDETSRSRCRVFGVLSAPLKTLAIVSKEAAPRALKPTPP